MVTEATIRAELAACEELAFGADQEIAKSRLLALLPVVGELDRDDLACEVLAQLGELYAERSAFDGAAEGARRIEATVEIHRGRADRTGPDWNVAMDHRMSCRAAGLRVAVALGRGGTVGPRSWRPNSSSPRSSKRRAGTSAGAGSRSGAAGSIPTRVGTPATPR
jgi:hypothetical protein